MYNKLDKELKKQTIAKFYATEKGINSKNRFKRIILCIFLLVIYGFYILMINEGNWWEFYLSIISFIGAIIIFLLLLKVRKNLLNDFLTSEKK